MSHGPSPRAIGSGGTAVARCICVQGCQTLCRLRCCQDCLAPTGVCIVGAGLAAAPFADEVDICTRQRRTQGGEEVAGRSKATRLLTRFGGNEYQKPTLSAPLRCNISRTSAGVAISMSKAARTLRILVTCCELESARTPL